MNRFRQDFSAALGGLADYFGDEAIYMRGEVALPMRFAILAEEMDDEQEAPSGRTRTKIRWMTVVTDPLSHQFCGAARLERDRVVIVGKVRYVIGSIANTPWGTQNVKLRRISQDERSREGMRGRHGRTVA